MSIAKTTTITIRTDAAVKEKAQGLFRELGLDLSTAINMFLRKSVQEERIPFVVEKPNWKTRRALKRVEKGKGLVGPFDTVEEAMKYLDS